MSDDIPGDLVILHISDTHFGRPDERQEMERITDALVSAVHGQELAPDVCIFSGDMSFSGDAKEYEKGSQWLTKLLDRWPKAHLFVVPGNHDVVRPVANAILRQIFGSEQDYSANRDSLANRLPHLSNFFDFSSALKSQFGARLVSEWSSPFACSGKIMKGQRPIRIIGLNTSLLSCFIDDEGKLVQDITALNQYLGEPRQDGECIVAVGHHPLNWLVPWNREEVQRLLQQQTGASLYLHGHRHEQASSTFATGVGESLCILECGAAYQGSRWPQYFSIYTLQFSQRDILPSVFLYSSGSGKWVKDNSRSEPFVAPLPPPFRQPVTRLPEQPVVDVSQQPGESPPALDENMIHLDTFRILDAASTIFPGLRLIMDSSLVRVGELYVHTSRMKAHDKIVKKVLRKREEDNPEYSVADVDDVIGFRYSTLFQSDLPRFIERLLETAFDWEHHGRRFRRDKGAKVTIHTSRPESDPLTVVESVKRVLREWGGPHQIETRSRSTGYSSIHIVLRHVSNRWVGDEDGLPVEFQLRSGLEHFWGQLDHQLRYELSRGEVGDSLLQKHLNVLKAQFDAAIQYLDVIKDVLYQGRAARASSKLSMSASAESRRTRSTGSFSTTQAQVQRLIGLPEGVYGRVREAFALWEDADASRQFGGDPNKFRLAADTFKDLFDNGPGAGLEDDLAARFLYIVRMERAYLLFLSGGPSDLEIAETIYSAVIDEYPNDAAALIRQGQVRMRLRKLDDAISHFEQAAEACLNSTEDEAVLIHDFARLNRALAFFRKFEQSTESKEVRQATIRTAIELSKEIVESSENDSTRHEALNNTIYFAWEEREFLHQEEGGSLSKDEYTHYARELIAALETEELGFREADTLVRVQLSLGNEDEARRHAREVCLLLEKAANVRSGADVGLERFSTRWVSSVLRYLLEEDERDALLFCANLLNSRSGRLSA